MRHMLKKRGSPRKQILSRSRDWIYQVKTKTTIIYIKRTKENF